MDVVEQYLSAHKCTILSQISRGHCHYDRIIRCAILECRILVHEDLLYSSKALLICHKSPSGKLSIL